MALYSCREMATGAVVREQTLEVRVAGLWIRSLAALLDLIVLAPILTACGLALRLALPSPDAEADLGQWLLEMLLERHPLVLAAGGFAVAVALSYVGVFTAMRGRTVGQRLLGLRVIDEDGEPPGLAAVALRTCALPVGLFLMGLGVLWIAFDREARGFHDHVSGTFVVRAPAAAGPGPSGPPEVQS
jgi:uncharacterized RDD family membrane protein YckC